MQCGPCFPKVNDNFLCLLGVEVEMVASYWALELDGATYTPEGLIVWKIR